MILDTPNEKGVSLRTQLEKVVRESGGKVVPPELENEVEPESSDEPIYNLFFEIYQRGQEFYQTLFYYQQIMNMDLDGEDITVLLVLWNTVNQYLMDKDKKKSKKNEKGKAQNRERPHRHRRL